MRQRAGGRAMKNPSIETELRSMAWANEMLLAIVKCVGATEVWAGDCERSQGSLVASQEATKRRIAGGILFAAVGHDERHSRGRIKSRRGTLSKLGDGGGERHPIGPCGGKRYTPIGATTAATVVVNRTPSHQPRNARRVGGFGFGKSALIVQAITEARYS